MCIIEQLLSIVCVNRQSLDNIQEIITQNNKKLSTGEMPCDLNGISLETKIGFDTIAFIFIIFQLRVLRSWFFQRCMIEFRCEMIQAKR